MSDKMNILIVYAHPEPKSFNAAMKNTAVDILEKLGHNVEVSDLYAMKFNPVMTRDRFKGELEDPDCFRLRQELRHGRVNGTLPDQVQTEIEKLTRADLLILQYPTYWASLPAILKGYLDICFPETVGYDFRTGKLFERSDFSNKRALLSLTTGSTPTMYSNSGLLGDIDVLLYPWMMNLSFIGYQTLAPQVVYDPEKMSDEQRKGALDTWKERLINIGKEDRVKLHNLSDFDMAKGLVLTDERRELILAEKFSMTPGQHLGKPFRPGCMTSSAKDTQM